MQILYSLPVRCMPPRLLSLFIKLIADLSVVGSISNRPSTSADA